MQSHGTLAGVQTSGSGLEEKADDGACLREGRNCGQIAVCNHAALLIDSARYFRLLQQVLAQARHSIIIIGWDFDGSINLSPPGEQKESLGSLLRRLVEQRPGLNVRILIWSLSILHAPGNRIAKLFGAAWQRHPRISFRLDHAHPFYACHHQKIVGIDDSLAFVGGIDLTVGRRDRRGHRFASIRRNPDGSRYGPVHDVQLMVDGPAAGAICAIARRRWLAATGEMPEALPEREFWPDGTGIDLQCATVGMACTSPGRHGQSAVQEGMRLTADMLQRARRSIYIEAQYFTATFLEDALAPLLEADDGPEIVLISSGRWHGWLERVLFGENQIRLLRRLKRMDRHQRLATFMPEVPGKDGATRILVHAKIMIIDDDIMRIGSSNLNNRSTGLDTECDVAIEAHTPADRIAIATARNRLLAEHLGCDPARLKGAVSAEGSLIGAIAALDPDHTRLVPLVVTDEGPDFPVFGTSLVDPPKPFDWLGRRIFGHWRREKKSPR